MPVEDFTDIDLGTDEKTFDQLDKSAAKAQKSLEKRNKELAKTQKNLDKAGQVREEAGGAFPQPGVPIGAGGPRDIAKLSKQDEKIEKRFRKLEKKIKKDEVKSFGKKSIFKQKFEDAVGKPTAQNIFNIGKNPISFLTNASKAIPFLGGVFAAKEMAEFVADELVKLDQFLKAFFDFIDERVADKFRSLQETSDVRAGLAQRIITTASGSTEPRYAYNTFEEFDNNQVEFEEKFQLNNKGGFE